MTEQLRVVCPYTAIHPRTDAALRELAPEAERVDVSGSDFAYFELLECLWKDGESFLLVEHDVELTREALEAAKTCSCDWGVSPYVVPYHGNPVHAGLGCTRFSSRLLRDCPNALTAPLPMMVAVYVNLVLPRHHYETLDVELGFQFMLRRRWPCQHPAVPHHHDPSDRRGYVGRPS